MTSRYPASLLEKPWRERWQYFREKTISHRRLVRARDQLCAALDRAEKNSIIRVAGPTGVGKTTLRLKAEKMLIQQVSEELTTDRGRIPIVSIEALAPESGSFSFSGFYRSLLEAANEPLIDCKREPGAGLERARSFAHARATVADLRYAWSQVVKHRRPLAVMVDEAQHLTKIASGRKMLDHMDVLKSIANTVETPHVLFGTYDLLDFQLNGQLARRTVEIHLPCYWPNNDEDREDFLDAVATLSSHVPFPDPPDLTAHVDLLFERSIGCVGILKEWLTRALYTALRSGAETITREILEAEAPTELQCAQIAQEAREGERRLTATEETRRRLYESLWLRRRPRRSRDPKPSPRRCRAAPTSVRACAAQSGTPSGSERFQLRNLLEPWDLTLLRIPPRARLVPLEPMGVGTPFIECVTSYMMRLADAHAVRVSDLIRKLRPEVVTLRPAAIPNAVNGIGRQARDWVQALEGFTLRTDLRSLTLLPFEPLFPPARLIRPTRAWCPPCLTGMQEGTGIVYEPLLWSFHLVEVCPHHGSPLVAVCPRCSRLLPPITATSRTGYCGRCRTWLGATQRSAIHEHTSDPTSYQLWLSNAIGELLALAPQLESVALKENLRVVLSSYVDNLAEGKRAAIVERGPEAPHGFYGWVTGKSRPRIDALMRLLYTFGLPVNAIITGRYPAQALRSPAMTRATTPGGTVAPRRSRDQLRAALELATREPSAPSLAKVARGLGYSTPSRLYAADPERCTRIVRNYRQSGQSHWWRRRGALPPSPPTAVKKALEDSLALDNPVPVHHLAPQLGYESEGALRWQCPELCRAIAAKRTQARASRRTAIGPALKAALELKHPTSLQDIARGLGYSSAAILRLHEPDLCAQLVARRKTLKHEDRRDITGPLKAVLRENPPPCLKTVCQRFGITRKMVHNWFRDICNAIAMRHLQYRTRLARQRRSLLEREVRRIVRRLETEGACPSVSRVREMLPPGVLRDWYTVGQAVRAIRRGVPPADNPRRPSKRSRGGILRVVSLKARGGTSEPEMVAMHERKTMNDDEKEG